MIINVSPENKTSGKLFENLVWMNSKEAASYIRVSQAQLRKLVWQKKILAYKFLGRLRFLKSNLDLVMKPSI